MKINFEFAVFQKINPKFVNNRRLVGSDLFGVQKGDRKKYFNKKERKNSGCKK